MPKENFCRAPIQNLIVDVLYNKNVVLVMQTEKSLKLHRKSFLK
jgi:hypothetical protein